MQPLASYPESPPPGPSSAQKALAAIAIMLGVLGVIGGCCGAASNMASGAILDVQGDLLGAQGMPGAEQQRELVAASQALVAKWAPFMVIVQLFNLVASGLLIAAGIQVWRAHAKATELTFIACGSSAIVDIAITLLAVLQQLETQELTRLMMPATTDPNLDATMQTGMKFGMMVGGCFAVGWLLAKLSSYVAFSMVMRRTQR